MGKRGGAMAREKLGQAQFGGARNIGALLARKRFSIPSDVVGSAGGELQLVLMAHREVPTSGGAPEELTQLVWEPLR